MKLKDIIIYEDADIIVIDKPSSLQVHDDGRGKGEETLADLILHDRPEMKSIGEPWKFEDPKTKEEKIIYRPGIVHRLDRETSGVMIVAKTQDMFEWLKQQFKDHTIKKTYHAIVWGSVKDDEGTINEPIGRSKKDFRKRLAGRGARGEMREAITYYRVLSRFEYEGNKFTYLELHPKTGRTHQLRVHMKYLNHPIACDALYTDKPCTLPLGRLALHAARIEIPLPSGEKKVFEVSAPKEMTDFLAKV